MMFEQCCANNVVRTTGNTAKSGGAVHIGITNRNLVFQFCVFESNSGLATGGAVDLSLNNEKIEFEGECTLTTKPFVFVCSDLMPCSSSIQLCRLHFPVQHCRDRWRCRVLVFQQHQDQV